MSKQGISKHRAQSAKLSVNTGSNRPKDAETTSEHLIQPANHRRRLETVSAKTLKQSAILCPAATVGNFDGGVVNKLGRRSTSAAGLHGVEVSQTCQLRATIHTRPGPR